MAGVAEIGVSGHPSGFHFYEADCGGVAMHLDSARLQECLDYVQRNGVVQVAVSRFGGYFLGDLEPLVASGVVDNLNVLDADGIDVRALESWEGLRVLWLSNCTQALDLQGLLGLETFKGTWFKRLRLPGDGASLSRLALRKYGEKGGLGALPAWPQLERLELRQGGLESLDGVEQWGGLSGVVVEAHRRLKSVKALAGIARLCDLELEGCKKILDLEDTLGRIVGLQRLRLVDCGVVQSLAWIEALAELESVNMWGTAIGDGDLELLTRLAQVNFEDKRGYSHTLREVRELIGGGR